MATYRWISPPASQTVTQFVLEKSEDAGLTWAVLTTIANDPTNAAVYDADLNRFFYVDATPVVGEIVRIRSDNSIGEGPYCYLYGPPEAPETVNLYGFVMDTLSGRPIPDIPVHVTAIDTKMSALLENAGMASLGAESGVAVRRSVMLVTDEDGRWQIDLLSDQIVVATIPTSGLKSVFRVPTGVDVLNFRDTSQYRISEDEFADIAGAVGVAVSLP